jgi:hypothetical protein
MNVMLDREDMKSRLKNGVCKVSFTKVNGETRVMHCTLNESMIPQKNSDEDKRYERKENDGVIAAWDLDKQDWRSFRVDSVTSFSSEFNL